MCGIAGLFLRDRLAQRQQLVRMADRLSHRGSDDKGFYQNRGVGLAHARLSIIDLMTGHQPLYADDGNLILVVNGEIYNFVELRAMVEARGYRFATNSDCETILGAYVVFGENGFLSYLRGMFAFALYDKRKRRMILARDRLGIKPLFLTQWGGGVAFASELKALLALNTRPVAVDAEGLIQYLENQFNAERTTIVEGIERILPGEALCIQNGHVVHRWRYWSPLNVRPQVIGFDEAQAQFDVLMETVVREHMRADVPFGLFLSGGVDSATLLALLTRYKNEPIRTFSVGFAGKHAADELPGARRMAKLFGSVHTEIRLTAREIFWSLPWTVWAADELMRDHANLPTSLLAKVASQELKVVFSGEAGDETFAGYGRYRASAPERALKNFLAPGSGGFRTHGTFRGFRARRLFAGRLRAARAVARAPFVKAWRETPTDWSDLQRMQYVDLITALPNNLFVKLDRMLMAWGVEGRVPFADHRVVEFGLALPDSLKVAGRQGKWFLKRWAARFIPEDHLFGRKSGFNVPAGAWMHGSFLARLRTVLPQQRAIREWFQPNRVLQLIGRCEAGQPASLRMMYALLQFAIWHRLFVDGDGVQPPAQLDPLELLGA